MYVHLGSAYFPGSETWITIKPLLQLTECRTGREDEPVSLVCTQKSSWSSHPDLLKMERSTQELFINFTVVLITVLLMWLLVRSYQY